MPPLLLCGLIAAATPSLPAAEDADVRDALARYEALEYGEVIPLLERALARPELAAGDRRLALAYLGRAHAIYRQAALAEEAFTQLLQVDPDFTVPEFESPLIRAAFARAKESAEAAAPEAAAPEVEPDAGQTSSPPAVSAQAPAPGLAPTPARSPARDVPPAPRPATAETRASGDEEDDSPPTAVLLAVGGAAAGALVLGGVTAMLLLEPWAPATLPSGSLGRWELP